MYNRRQKPRGLIVEALESRQLFSAGLEGVLLHAETTDSAVYQDIDAHEVEMQALNSTAVPTQTENPTEPTGDNIPQSQQIDQALAPSNPAALLAPAFQINSSGDAAASDFAIAQTDLDTLTASSPFSAQDSLTQPAKELVIIDSQVTDYQQLVDDIKASGDPNRQIDIVILSADQNGIEQITHTLSSYHNLDAVHVIAHGASATQQLVADWLNASALHTYSADIATWKSALSEQADILLYGCDVTADQSGQDFISHLAQLTGADVAASNDATGSNALGGDWVLEDQVGTIETALFAPVDLLQNWQHTLALTPQGTETLVNQTTAGTQQTVSTSGQQIAFDANGNYVVVWEDNSTSLGFNVYARLFNANGTPRSAEFRVNTDTTFLRDHNQPTVAMDANGNFVVAWASNGQDGSGWSIYEQRFNASGVAQGTEFKVNTTTIFDQTRPAIAMNTNGYVITWTSASQDGGGEGVYAQRFSSAGIIQGTEFKVNTTTDWDQNGSDIAMDASGNFVIAWSSYNQDSVLNKGVFAQRYNASGIAQGGEVQINTTTNNDQTLSSVSMNDSGSYVIAWTSDGQDGGFNGAYARLYNSAGSAISGEIQLSSTTAWNQQDPSVAMDSTGTFVASWSSYNQDAALSWGIYLRQFDASGTALTAETLVNTTTANFQELSSVTLNNNKAIVSWSGNGSGDTQGIFTQQFNVSSVNNAPTDLYTVSGVQPSNVLGVYGFTSASNLGQNGLVGNTAITLTGNPGQVTGPSGSGALDLAGGASGQFGDIVGITTGGAMTFAASVRFDSTGSYERVFDFGQTNSGGIGNIYVARSGISNDLTFTIEVNGVAYRANATGAITNGTWLHFAATVDAAGNMKLYVNGVLGPTTIGVAPTSGVRTNNYIGKSHWGADAAFDGAIDNFVVANGAMTASQVAALYSQSTGFSVPENSANGAVVGTVVAFDPDSSNTFSYSLTNNAGGRFAINPTTGAITVAGGSLLDYESATSHSITVQVTDQGFLSYSEAFTVNLTNVIDPPTITTTGSTLSYSEGAAATVIDSGLTLTGSDTPNLASATVTIASGFATGEDTLAFTNQNGISGSWNATTGVLTLTGSSSVANYQAALRSITYVNLSHTPSTTTRSIAFQVNNGTANSTVVSRNISVSAVNDTPTATNLSAAETYTNNVALNLSDIVISDVDSATVTATLTLSNVAAGSLNTATSGAVTSTYIPGTGVWTASGAIANVNTLLAGLTFTPNLNFSNNFTIATTVSDGTTTINGSKIITEAAYNGTSTAPSDLSTGINLNTDAGNNAYLRTTSGGSVFGGLTALTLEVNYTLKTPSSVSNPLLSYASPLGSTNNEVMLTVNASGRIQLSMRNIDLISSAAYTQLLDGKNHALAVSWDNTNGDVVYYIDGQLVGTSTGFNVGTTLAAGGTLVFGQDQDLVDGGYDAAQVFSGTLHDILVWNRAVSAEQIALNYQQKLADTPAGLVASWRMTGLAGGTTVVDAVSGNNLTVANIPIGGGWNASTPTAVLTIAENAANGTTVGSVVVSAANNGRDIVQDVLFREASDPGVFTNYTSGQSFGNWTVQSGNVDLNGTAFQASPLGGRSIDLNGTNTGAIEQVLSTTAGRQYQVIFNASGNWTGGDVTKDFRVSAAGTNQDFSLTQPTAWSTSNMLFSGRSMTFTATGSNTTLVFESLDTGNNCGAVIADVRVIEIPATVQNILANDATLSYDAGTGKFYRAVNSAVTAPTAIANATAAQLNGVSGQLVTVGSAYENNLIWGFAQTLNGNVYLGGRDATTEGSWRLLSGASETFQFSSGSTAVTGFYTNWAGVQPGGGTTENQLAMSQIDGQWHDVPDNQLRYYVIEWDASEVLSNYTYMLTSNPSGAFAINSNTGEITVSNAASLNEIASDPTITVQVTDAAGNSYSEAFTIAVTRFNDNPPVITSNGGGASASINVAENTTTVTTITATDADLPAQTFTYSIVGGADSAFFSISSTTGALSFVTGRDFETRADAGANNVYDITIRVDDGTNWVDQAIAVSITNVNEAPVLDNTGTMTLTTITEDDTANAGQTVASIISSAGGDRITDVDTSAVEGIAITATTNGNGAWQYSTNGGTIWTAVGTVAGNSALLLRSTDMLRFIPNGQNATTGDITFRAWDQTSGTAGTKVDVSTNGGTTAFSTATETASITVTAINDAASFLTPGFGGSTGMVTTAVGTGASNGNGVTVQADGKVLVAGSSSSGFTLLRYNIDGSLDTSFNGTGQAVSALGGSAYSVIVQGDGKILVAGESSNDFGLVRYNANGSLDTGFGSGGIVTTSVGAGFDGARSVTLQSDGKILVAGYSRNGTNDDFALVRYNANGSLDTGFGSGGKITESLNANQEVANSVMVQSDGKILVAGTSRDGGTGYASALVRYNGDGSLDSSFGTGGKQIVFVWAALTGQVSLQSDGKILLAGTAGGFPYDFQVARLNTDGSLDASFGSGGMAVINIGSFDYGASVIQQTDGRIVVVGQSRPSSDDAFAVARLEANGTLDTSFGVNGKLTTDIRTAGNDIPTRVTLQADGEILVVGSSWNGSQNDIALVRYNVNGSLDTSLGANSLDGMPAYTEGAAATVLDSNVLVWDAELSAANNFNGANLTLARNGGADAQDVFSATGTLGSIAAASGNLVVGTTTIGTYTNSAGTLVFSFNANATNALVNSAMQQIAYANNSDAPPASVQINWTFNDGNSGAQGTGGALTATGNVTVSITAVNDAPVLDNSGNLTLTSITEDNINNAGQTVASIVASDGGTRITDPDGAGALQGIAITSLNTGYGKWQYSMNSGSTWLDVGTVASNSALLLRSTDLIRFLPQFENGSNPDFTFRAWDQTSGTVGTKVSTTSNGGTTAFSTATETASIVVTDVNDAPVLDNSRTPVLASITEDAGLPVGSVGTLVSSLVDFQLPGGQVDNVADDDIGSQLGIAITGTNSSNGTWYYSTDNGTNWQVIGSVSGASALLLAADANTRIYFTPSLNYNGTISDAITFRAWDQSSGSNGALANTTSSGGTSAFSVATDTASFTVTAVNDTIGLLSDANAAANTVAENATIGTTVGATALATDVDSGDTVTYSLDFDANGRYTIDSSTGVITVAGALNAESQFTDTLLVRATSSDGSAVTRGFHITVTSVNEAPNDIRIPVSVATENFESGATGWSNNQTVAGGATLTNYLGGWGNEIGTTQIFKDFTLSGSQTSVTITFDMYELDSWDGEAFKVWVDGVEYSSHTLWMDAYSNFYLGREDEIAITQQMTTGTSSLGGGVFDDEIHRYSFTINTTGSNIRLGFSSNLDWDVSNESWGVDNLSIVENRPSLAIAENSANGATVGSVQGYDVDAGNTLTYSLTDNAGGRFAINSSTGTITVADGSLLNYEAATSHSVTVQVSDGSLTYSEAVTINVTNVNEAPVLDNSGTMTLTTITEDQTTNSGNIVASIIATAGGDRITDLDSGAVEGIAITGLTNGNGTWQYSINGGLNWRDVGVVSANTALLLRETDSIRFVPDGNAGTTADISFRAWDQTTGIAGEKADTSPNGGTTAFSTATETAAIAVTDINDGPTFHNGLGYTVLPLADSQDELKSAILADGKIVVAGTTFNGTDLDVLLVRYNTDGSLDTSFGTNGIVQTPLGTADDNVNAVVIQSDGKIIVSGSTVVGGNTQLMAARFNSNGTLDTGFGAGGIGLYDVAGTADRVNAIMLTDDGKILLAGTVQPAGNRDYVLVRINNNGSLDTSLGGTGIVQTNVQNGDNAQCLTVQPDGKILLAGLSVIGADSSWSVVRFNVNGSLDTSFGTGGIFSLNTSVGEDRLRGISVLADGKILIAGRVTNVDADFAVARLNSSGVLDTSFGVGGIQQFDLGGDDLLQTMEVMPDGKVVLVGRSLIAGNTDAVVLRLNADGSIDNAFGTNGATRINLAAYDSFASVSRQVDGKLLLSGSTDVNGNRDTMVVRLTSSGQLDLQFATSNSLGGTVAFTEGGSPVVLDGNVAIFDTELSKLDNFAGSTLTLVRSTGANAEDALAFDGITVTTSGTDVFVNGVQVATYVFTGGQMDISFGANATQSRVNTLMQNLVYWNSSDAPPASVQMSWTFNDGNLGTQGTGGALQASGNTTVNITAVNDAPQGTVSISGTASRGNTLTASNNLSDADGLGAISYQWQRDGIDVVGATGNSYLLGVADIGSTIRVVASYTDGHGTVESVASAQTAAITNVNTVPVGLPVVTGSATENQILSADTSGISDADGLGAFSYQWLRGGLVISGATNSSYTLSNADVGEQISVQVSYTDGLGTAEQLTSGNTAAILNINDAPVGTVNISGTASRGNTLTASNTLSDADGMGTISYQWQRDGVDVVGATGSSYLLGVADIGSTLRVIASYTDGHGTAESVASNPTAAVTNVNTAPVGLPIVTGSATENQTLTADTSGISDADGLSVFSYQWLRGGLVISGATNSSYTLSNADVGEQISVQVSYTDTLGTAEQLTNGNTTAILNVNDAPVGTVNISGTASRGNALTASNNLTDADGLGIISYQWQRDGVDVVGATGNTYLLGVADIGSTIRVIASYTDGHGTAESVASAQTAAITNVNTVPAGLPVVTGTTTENQTLTADTSGISDADGLGAFSYQWLRGGLVISGATNSSYTLSNADVGEQISVQVSYTDTLGTAEQLTSGNTTAILNVNDAPVGTVNISGTASRGNTLTASNNLTDADGLGIISYQWQRDGVDVVGATGNTYLLGVADIGSTIRVIASYTDGHGTAESVASAQTAAITNVNTVPAGLPVVTGTTTENQTLSADTSGISDADGLGTFSYQWLRNGSQISGATASTYTLGNSDVGQSISVQVSYTDALGTAEQLTSGNTAAILNINDAPVGSVSISGTASRGNTLTASNTLSDADGLGTISYQWQRDGVDVVGATGNSYLLGVADIGSTLRVIASYTDGHGTVESVASAQTAAITNVNTVPIGLPVVTGTTTENQTLSADTSGISDADGLGVFSYQWLRGGLVISGATNSSYTLSNADVGEQISVQVSYTDGLGTAEQLTSGNTAAILNINDAPVGSVSISGTASRGNTLTASNTLSDADGLGTISYQWQRDGVDVVGATGNSYLLGVADIGSTLRVIASYTDGHGTVESVASAQTAALTNVNTVPIGLPIINGAATENQTLSADTSGISDADGLGTVSYQWLRGGVTISGATASTYTLTNSDVGQKISVKISYSDGLGTAEQLTSAETASVSNINDAPSGTVSISGTASRGQTLTASNNLTDADGLGVISYQWQRDGVNVAGTTGSTYALGAADVGKAISVVASYTDGHGSPESVASRPTALITKVNTLPIGLPLITGSATENQTLTVDTSGISDADGLGTFSYQWLRGGLTISDATSSTYTLTKNDVGQKISVQVSYMDGLATAEQLTSAETATVSNINDAPSGTVSISGTASRGQTLTASNNLSDADGLGAISYQWQRDGVNVAGANGSTYTLGAADVGTVIRVVASYTDGHGTAESVASSPTAAVANVNTVPVGLPVITGSPTEGQELIADTSKIRDADGITIVSYKWLRNGAVIIGANDSRYILGKGDVDQSISVQITYSDGLGFTTTLSSEGTASISQSINKGGNDDANLFLVPNPGPNPSSDRPNQSSGGSSAPPINTPAVVTNPSGQSLSPPNHLPEVQQSMVMLIQAGNSNAAQTEDDAIDRANIARQKQTADTLMESNTSLYTKFTGLANNVIETKLNNLADLDNEAGYKIDFKNPLSASEEKMLWQNIANIKQGIEQSDTEHAVQDIEIYIASTVTLTAGFVSWVLRGGALLASFMSSMPLLKGFDPLPIVNASKQKAKRRKSKIAASETDAQDAKVENMFSDANGDDE